MKDLFWKMQAALVREILNDFTTVEDLRTNLDAKTKQIGDLLAERNPELFQEFQTVFQSGDINSVLEGATEFFEELLQITAPKTETWTNAPSYYGFNYANLGSLDHQFPLFGNDVLYDREPLSLDEVSESESKADDSCRCPNLLVGHLNGCSFSKIEAKSVAKIDVATWKKELSSKLGIYSKLAEDAILFAATDEQVEDAEQQELPYVAELEEGDLLLVEEDSLLPSDKLNVNGPFIAVISNPCPIYDDEGYTSDPDDIEVLVVDALNNKVNKNYWLTKEDRIVVLRNQGQAIQK